MTAEARVLERARQVWRVAQPTTEDAAAALRRVRARRALRRSAAPRRLVMAVVMLLAMGSALAWAASRGATMPWSASAPGVERLDRAGPHAGRSLAGAVRHATPVAATEAVPAPADESEATAESSPMGATRVTSPRAASSVAAERGRRAPAPTWGDVDRALAQRDEGRAERALSGLAQRGDGATRAKAWLGLAQLAAARGECAEVTRLVTAIAAEPSASAGLRQMAQRLAASCRPAP